MKGPVTIAAAPAASRRAGELKQFEFAGLAHEEINNAAKRRIAIGPVLPVRPRADPIPRRGDGGSLDFAA